MHRASKVSGKFFGTAQQGCTQAVIMDEGMDIQRIQLGFFEVHLEKTLYHAFIFDHPQCFLLVFHRFDIAFHSQQLFPCLQYALVVTADAGILHGVAVGIVDEAAVLPVGGAEYGQQALYKILDVW